LIVPGFRPWVARQTRLRGRCGPAKGRSRCPRWMPCLIRPAAGLNPSGLRGWTGAKTYRKYRY